MMFFEFSKTIFKNNFQIEEPGRPQNVDVQ